MADRRTLHEGDTVSKETQKAIAAREKEKSDLAKAASKANTEEAKRK